MRWIQLGNIKIGKGYKYIFSTIDGLSDGDINRNKHEYAGLDGAEYTDPFYDERSINITGNIIAENFEELDRLSRALTHEINGKKDIKIAYYNGFRKKYYATAIADGLPVYGKPFGNNNLCARKFSINLIIPGFYWLSEKIQTISFQVFPMLSKNTVLPSVFSTRQKSSAVKNDGDAETYPIIELFCNVPNTEDIVIENVTQGKTLILDYTMSAGEVVTIDCENKKITSSVNGDITSQLDSIRSFFSLGIGKNLITVNTIDIQVKTYHFNRFLGV